METMVVKYQAFYPYHVSVWNDHMNADNEQLNIMYAYQMVLKLLRGP